MRSALLAFGGLAACSAPSTPDAGVDAGPMLTVVETCDLLAAAKCELLGRCYAAFNRDAPADCRSLQQARCLAEYDTLKGSFENNRVQIDVKRALTCQERMKASACPPSFPPDYFSFAAHPFSDCSWQTGLLIGKVKSGDSCDHPVECAPGVVCVKPGGVCKGTCSSFAAENEPCAFGCAQGLRCDDLGDDDPNNDVCKPIKQVNEPCARSSECAAELVCNVTCRPRSKDGEACQFDPDRLSTCDPGLACDVVPFVRGMVGKCVKPRETFQPCRFHWACQPGLVCSDIDWTGFPDVAPGMGSCRPPGAKDTGCGATVFTAYVGDQCEAGTQCSMASRTCTTIPKLGETCSPAQTCAGVNVYCKPAGGDTGSCTGPASVGDRCSFSLDSSRSVEIPCATGFCDGQSTQTCRQPFRPLNDKCKVDGECLSGRCAVQQDRTLRCAMACN